MKYLLLLVFACILAGCFSRSTAMTNETYSTILTGSSIEEVESEVGSPYAIHDKGKGIKEYEYIERIDGGGPQFVIENHYYIVVQDGKVVSKYVKQERSPAYDLIYQEDPNYNYYPYSP